MTGSLLLLSLTAFVGCAVAYPFAQPYEVHKELRTVQTFGDGITSVTDTLGYSYAFEQNTYIAYDISLNKTTINSYNDGLVYELGFNGSNYFNNDYDTVEDWVAHDGMYNNARFTILMMVDDTDLYFYPFFRPFYKEYNTGTQLLQYFVSTVEFMINYTDTSGQFDGYLVGKNTFFNSSNYDSYTNFTFGKYYGWQYNMPIGDTFNENKVFSDLFCIKCEMSDPVESFTSWSINFRFIGDCHDTSYMAGYNDGYSKGNIDGFNDGKLAGYDEGYNLGVTNGYNTGYSDGYSEGYAYGITLGGNASFTGLFGAIADTPIIMLRSLFNFDLFGMNVFVVIMSLLTGIIVIYVIKKVWK